jgi:predicted Zn-dependent protease
MNARIHNKTDARRPPSPSILRHSDAASISLPDGRPVLDNAGMTKLAERILGMTSTAIATVTITHTAYMVTRMANDQVLSGNDGDTLTIQLSCRAGRGLGATIQTNQVSTSMLRAIVDRAESIAREKIRPIEDVMPVQEQVSDALVPVALWHDSTVSAMTTARETVVPEMMLSVMRGGFGASGFVGLMARAETFMTKAGISVYSEETDSEITVTARTKDGRGSGWGGQAARDWSRLDYRDVAQHATRIARLNADPVALEPGRRTAILSRAAVAQLLRSMGEELNAFDTDSGHTGFSKLPSGNRLRQRVFDPRISIRSDPADADGGYRPYFNTGFGSPAMSWVEGGVLKNLAYNPVYAMSCGKPYAEDPWSIRVSGGNVSVDDMIAHCREGIYVNRLSSVELVDKRTGLTTGVTRDGCFLVKDGKIVKALKNFRILESPFFFLNKLEALGVSERAALGYTPPRLGETGPTDWPRRPMIVPPMMVHDFNFSALADAV